MRLLSLSFLFFISISSYSQVFGYGYGHLVYQKLLEKGICYIKTGDAFFDSTMLKALEDHWTVSDFTYVEQYKKPTQDATALFLTEKEMTKKYFYDRAIQKILVLQPSKNYKIRKEVPKEETLAYMYYNGFHALATEDEYWRFNKYIIIVLNKGLEMIRDNKYKDNQVELNNRIIEDVNENNRSYNGNTLIINREMTRSFLNIDKVKSLDIKYKLLGKEEYYKALESKRKDYYLLYFSVNTGTELSLICVEDGRWIYTKQFPEGYTSLKPKELKLLKHYF